ncbi:hypothetical protein JOM56_004021 [Amanita muscaria]
MSAPCDDPDFQFSDEAEKRIEARRKLLIDALLAAGGEPADGRWTHVAQLSRLGVTRGGRRWLGTNVERGIQRKETPDAQEKKRIHDDFLRQKVESWKQALTRSGASGAAEGDVQKPNAARLTRDTRSSGVLNFKVTKRGAPSNAPKPQISSGQPSELSFLPPSFPSHLATSTPQHPPRRKPAPIPRVTVSSPSENVQVYDDTVPPSKPAVPSSSRTADSKTSAPLPTLTELLVTSKMKARQRRMSQSTNSSPPRLNTHSGNRFNSANDDATKARTTSLGFLDVHDPGGIEFDPPFTSTQISAPINGDSSPRDMDLWRGYNSQFDVDRRTADVAKLLDKDVVIEY